MFKSIERRNEKKNYQKLDIYICLVKLLYVLLSTAIENKLSITFLKKK